MKSIDRREFLIWSGGGALAAAGLAAGEPSGALIARSFAQAASPVTPSAFEPIELASWVRDVTRMSFLAPSLAKEVAAIGVQVVHSNSLWPYYPLRRDGGGPSEAERDALRAFVSDVHESGMKLVLGLPPFPSVSAMKAHPEWRIASDPSAVGQVIEPLEENLGTRLACNLGPWGDYLIELCAELLVDFDLDGYSFDGNYHAALCHCNACRTSYQAERQRDLPAAIDLNQIEYREYLVWRGEKLEEHYRRLQMRLKGINPNAVIMTWSVNAGRYGHLLHSPRAMPTRLNLLIDLPMQEWWLDESNFGASIAPAFGAEYLAAVTGYRACGCEPYLMSRGNPYSGDSFPAHERMVRSLQTLAHGSTTAHSVGWSGGVAGAAPIFAETKRREPWITRAEPLRWGAILVSEQTRQFFAWRDIADRYLPHLFGSYRAVTEEHLPFCLINDWDLNAESLARYQVVILPNAAALSDLQCQALRDYVTAGGGLIATAETSLCDELGRAREDFGLADLFGVSYVGAVQAPAEIDRTAIDENFARSLPEEYWAKRAGSATLFWDNHAMVSDPQLQSLVPNRSARFKGPLVHVTQPKDSSEPVARLILDGPTGQPSADTPLPAVIAKSFGKGKVVYMAAGIDAALFSYAYPYQRMLARGAIDWVAAKRSPIEVIAPMCVRVNYKVRTSETGESQLVLHFVNDINTAAQHGAPAVDVPLREESPPIHGIQVRFLDHSPISVHWEPEGETLDLESRQQFKQVTLPPLHIHSMLIGEGWS